MPTSINGNGNISGPITLDNSLTLSNQTASTIASFDGSKNLASLSTATYPSLTELSYVKGLTSSLQTQLDDKASKGVSSYGSNLLFG